jgi:hypothetical protein
MIRKDYMLKLVEEFGKIIRKIAGLKDEGNYEQAQSLLDKTMEGSFKFTSFYLDNIANNAFIDILIKEHQFGNEQLTLLADLLQLEGEMAYQQGEYQKSKIKLSKSLIILAYLSETNPHIYSFDREIKMDNLRQDLQDLQDL